MDRPNVTLSHVALVIAGGSWLLASVFQTIRWGLFGAAVSLPAWWLSLLEAFEFALWLPTDGGNLGFFLGNLGTAESWSVLAGLFAFAGWAALTGAVLKLSESINGKRAVPLALFLNLLFHPVIALATVGYFIREYRQAGSDVVA